MILEHISKGIHRQSKKEFAILDFMRNDFACGLLGEPVKRFPMIFYKGTEFGKLKQNSDLNDNKKKSIGPIYINNFRQKATYHLTDNLPFGTSWFLKKNPEDGEIRKIKTTNKFIFEKSFKYPFEYMEWKRTDRVTKH